MREILATCAGLWNLEKQNKQTNTLFKVWIVPNCKVNDKEWIYKTLGQSIVGIARI